MTIEPEERDRVRGRLGRVGVWMTQLGMGPAAFECAAAAEIEQLGYPALWFGETAVNKEAFAHAAILLAATERMVIATGIAGIYGRDPAAMRNGARTLAEAYPGRFLLGIGVSHAHIVEQRGHEYARPVSTMRAYLDGMDAAAFRPPAPDPQPAVLLAALRTRMLELARDRADGAHPYLVTPDHTATARAILGEGPLLATEQGFVLESDPDRARAIAREHLAGYLDLPNYRNSWRAEGFGEDDLAGGGSDRLVDALIAWGKPAAVAERAGRHLTAGADHVCLQPVTRDSTRALAELRELAPAVLPLTQMVDR